MQAGQLIGGRYRLEEQIGSGGMGVVWRATDLELGRTVAIKHVNGDDERKYRSMIREAKIASRLNHPNIVLLFDSVTDGGDRFLVMEYVPAPDLAVIVERHGRLAPRQVAGIGAQLADALDAVGDAGIVHGDVKPSNVLVAGNGKTKLTDFGIARLMSGESTVTDTAALRGTPSFMAPEVARGESPTFASDLFSLGATLFTAVEGESPYGTAEHPYVIVRRAAACDVRACSYAGPLTWVLEKLLAEDPAERLPAARVRDVLSEVAAGKKVEPPPPPVGAPPLWRRTRWRIGAAAITAAAAVAAAVFIPKAFEHNTPVTPLPQQLAAASGISAGSDPCALMNPAALARFGKDDEDPHYGSFNRCDVIVHLPNGVDVDMAAQFDPPGLPAPTATPSPIGTSKRVSIIREKLQGDECDRELYLPANHVVNVYAKRLGDVKVDLCGIADVATNSAATVLDRGQVPTRAFDTHSLARVNACKLVNAAALRGAGVPTVASSVGFANWECEWYNEADGVTVVLSFDQNTATHPVDTPTEQLGGHTASVLAGDDGPGTCVAQVLYRTYIEQAGPVNELVRLETNGHVPTNSLCARAKSLATSAATALPRV